MTDTDQATDRPAEVAAKVGQIGEPLTVALRVEHDGDYPQVGDKIVAPYNGVMDAVEITYIDADNGWVGLSGGGVADVGDFVKGGEMWDWSYRHRADGGPIYFLPNT